MHLLDDKGFVEIVPENFNNFYDTIKKIKLKYNIKRRKKHGGNR